MLRNGGNGVFRQIKSIPLPEIVSWLGLETKKDKIQCPFHPDKEPSLHIFTDGFKCFGCGAWGDGVDLVAEIKGLSLGESAKEICSAFGIMDLTPVKRSKPTRVRVGRRAVLEELKAQEAEAFRNLSAIHRVLFRYANTDPYIDLLLLYYEDLLDRFTFGSAKEKRELVEKWGCEL